MGTVSPENRTAKREETISKLLASDKVKHQTKIGGFPMLTIQDKPLVDSLALRGARVNWYTRSRNPQVREAEVVLGPQFMP